MGVVSFFYGVKMPTYGRRKITVPAEKIDESNIVDIIGEASTIHQANAAEIDYLYNYYRGEQDILNRTKTYNTSVLNKIVENRAYEIVSFKKGYIVGEPIQYTAVNKEKAEAVAEFNRIMELVGKEEKDISLFEWIFIAGTAFMAALPEDAEDLPDSAPLVLDVVDPRNAYAIYSSQIGGRHLATAYLYTDAEGVEHSYVYTPGKIYDVANEEYTVKDNPIGLIPIIEYPANNSRLGSFEVCTELLNAINTLDSNRLDGIEQFIQSLLVLTNVELEDGEDATTIKEKGLLLLKSIGENKAEIDLISSQLDQSQAQTLKNDLYNAVLTICSMPNRNSGNGDTTGIAVVYRDGWSAAETSAKATESMYKRSDTAMRRVICTILTQRGSIPDLTAADIVCNFTRNNYDNLSSKVTALINMLGCDWIDRHYAYRASGLFVDSEEACLAGIKFHEEQAAAEAETETEATV